MAGIDKPSPPGHYPVVVVGSGPGALQTSYFLKKIGIVHAVVSRDEAPGGMFQRFPIFDRLISWTKLSPPVERGSREYEWFDWNSLLVDDAQDFVGVDEFMAGTSEFPSRDEMNKGLAAFAVRNRLPINYGCAWESTSRSAEGFTIHTTDGDYTCKVAAFAVGMTEPWKPEVPGIEDVPHYMEIGPPESYKGKRIYLMGKGASAFEIADGLMHVAEALILSSPHQVRPSVIEHSLAGVRARYMQPMEDAVFGGRTVTILDASTQRIEKTSNGYRVHLMGTSHPWEQVIEVDEAISATGVSVPLNDLPSIGVQTFYRGGRLPAQTPFWESGSVPGIYFSGSITQGAHGIRKNAGVGAVHGFRYNSRIQAWHIAEKHFGMVKPRPTIDPKDAIQFLLKEVGTAPELWNQRMYLARALVMEKGSIVDEGILPLTHFVDSEGPDGVAVSVMFDEHGDSRPAIYTRKGGKVEENLLQGHELLDFTTSDHQTELRELVKGILV